MAGIVFKRILVAIETDATRYHGEHPARPGLPGKSGAEQMLSHLSTDLAALFGDIKSCALCMAGALYDQTELLRPTYPVFTCLEKLLNSSFGQQSFQPRLLSFGADAGRLPEPELQPSEQVPLGVLLVLPLVVGGDPDVVHPLAEEMESRFIEAGQLSAHSARAVEAQFGVRVNHARFMTLADLNAMLRMQLEHFGFLPLWELLDAAINDPDTELTVEGRGGQVFRWTGERVESRFLSFDEWANTADAEAIPAGNGELAVAYTDWTREYRQYLTTLRAHGINVHQALADGMQCAGDGTFAIEKAPAPDHGELAQVTEHSSGDLGTVAVSMLRDGRQFNYYPLVPAGLNRLHAAIRDQLADAPVVAFPGCILYDERSRRLRPDSLAGV
ncbi:MAG: hypothetical protein HKN58_01955 [Xanthomonadales bacterium]|nr:hypothetical protein [Xanthomonadales bacterium]